MDKVSAPLAKQVRLEAHLVCPKAALSRLLQGGKLELGTDAWRFGLVPRKKNANKNAKQHSPVARTWKVRPLHTPLKKQNHEPAMFPVLARLHRLQTECVSDYPEQTLTFWGDKKRKDSIS